MPWGFAVAAVTTYVGSRQQAKGADRAGKAAQNAQYAAIDEQHRQYDQTRQDMLPFLEFGQWAIPKQKSFLEGDWSGFMNSPDYAYALDQGLNALDRSAASRGGLFGGGHTKDLTKFGQGMALQNANNYWNKLAGISGQGQSAGQSLGALGQNMANAVSQAYTNAGNARASSYMAQGNIQANAWNNYGKIAGGFFGGNPYTNGGWGG